MTGLDDFFASPRKAKNTLKTQIKEEAPTPKRERVEKPVERKVEREEAPKRDRYRAEEPSVRTYPERTYDKFATKNIQIREEDWDILRALTSEIREAKRNMHPDLRPKKRITENTVIRLLIQNFAEGLEEQLHNADYQGVQTEEEVKNFINETMKF